MKNSLAQYVCWALTPRPRASPELGSNQIQIPMTTGQMTGWGRAKWEHTNEKGAAGERDKPSTLLSPLTSSNTLEL